MSKLKSFNDFISIIVPELTILGYRYFEPSITTPSQFFYKPLPEGNLLGLGIFSSGINKYVANFFVSKTTIWIPSADQIPEKSVCGLFQLMSETELFFFAPAGDSLLQQWKYQEQENVNLFLTAVNTLEGKFLNQNGLIEAVNKNPLLNDMKHYVLITHKNFEKITSRVFGILKPKKDVSSNFSKFWIMAANATLKEERAIQNENNVKNLAFDAFIQYNLFQK